MFNPFSKFRSESLPQSVANESRPVGTPITIYLSDTAFHDIVYFAAVRDVRPREIVQGVIQNWLNDRPRDFDGKLMPLKDIIARDLDGERARRQRGDGDDPPSASVPALV